MCIIPPATNSQLNLSVLWLSTGKDNHNCLSRSSSLTAGPSSIPGSGTAGQYTLCNTFNTHDSLDPTVLLPSLVCCADCIPYLFHNIIYKSCFASFPTFSLGNSTALCCLLNTIRWANLLIEVNALFLFLLTSGMMALTAPCEMEKADP